MNTVAAISSPALNGKERVRRSQRLTLAIPLTITSLDPCVPYAEKATTIVVNQHGCAVRVPRPLDARTPVLLTLKYSQRTNTAHVLQCGVHPDTISEFQLDLEFDSPDNFWGVEFPPDRILGEAAAHSDQLSEPAAVLAPLPPPVAAPLPPAAMSSVSAPDPQQFEDELRRRARVVAAELEEEHRGNLRDLLVSLRAELAQDVNSERERLGPVDDLTRSLREQIETDAAARAETQATVTAALEEVRQASDYADSLVRLLPQTLEQRVQQAVAAISETWKGRLEEDFALRSQSLAQRLEEQERELAEQLTSQLRQRFDSEFARHEQEFITRVNNLLEQLRGTASQLRDYAHQSTDSAHHSRQALAEAQIKYESLLEERARALQNDLENRSQQLSQTTANGLRNLSEALGASLKADLQSDFEKRQQELCQSSLALLGKSTELLDAQTDELASRLDVILEGRLKRAASDTLDWVRGEVEQMRSQLGPEPLQHRLDDAQAQFDSVALRRTEEFGRQFEAAQARLRTTQEQLTRSLVGALQSEHKALLSGFQQEARDLWARSLNQWQEAVNEGLSSMGAQLRQKIARTVEPEPETDGLSLGSTDFWHPSRKPASTVRAAFAPPAPAMD